MTDHQKNIVGTILMNTSTATSPISEEMICTLVDSYDNVAALTMGTSRLTEEERNEVIAELHTKMFVRIDRGHFVKEKDHTPWYIAARANKPTKFWDRYRIYLQKEQHWNRETVNELDKTTDEIMDLLERITERYGTTILMVTHDLTLVNKHRKRTVVLEHGHIVADLAEGGYVRHDQ